MKVQEIIKLVCDFVGEKELREKLDAEATLTDKQQEKIDAMVRCFNLVNKEVATDFVPFLTKEEVDGQIINFSSLKKKVVHIFALKNRFGMNLRFKCFPNFVEAEGRAKTVLYSFFPEELVLTDEVQCASCLSARVFAYGVASEYLLIFGISDDAEIWENRFKQSLFMLTRKKGEHLLPKRRWL